MATKIVTKNSSTASAVPTASDLVQGELAVNVADKRLFTEDNAGAIVELGTNPSTLTVTGVLTGTSLDISGNIDVDGTTNLDVVDIDGAVDMASTLAVGTRVGIGVAAHASAALNITTTEQHIRFNNGSELGIIDLDSDGELNIWAHGDAEVINLRTGSGTGNNILTITGNASTFAGTVTANAGVVVDNFTIDGNEIDVSSGDLTLDVAGDISLDAAGNQINFKSNGTSRGYLDMSTGGLILRSLTSDADIILQGTDGASSVNALTLDMSAGGSATFNSSVTSAGLHSTTAGTSNFIAGVNAGNSIASGGNQNTVIGDEAGTAITTGDQNVAIGFAALSSDTLGSRSVAIGGNALILQNFTSAENVYNTAVGANAGSAVSTGLANTFVGGLAGDTVSTGSNNVIVGQNSDGVSYLTKGNGLGKDLTVSGGYTTLGFGSDDIRAAHGNVTWSTVSDQRYKKDIADATAGLSFINALQPRTFKYKNLGELPETFSAYEADSTEVFKNSNTNHGFIAQEVKAAIDADSSIKDGFRLWDDRDDGSQEVAEAALIPVLTKAIQELSAQVEALTARIETVEG